MTRRFAAAALVACLGLLAACGGDDDDGSAADTGTESTGQSTGQSTGEATDQATADQGDDATATGGTADSSDATGDDAPVEITTLSLGAVPTLDLGAIGIAREQGIFDKYGIAVDITFADGGPAVVTGVVSGQFDLGYTAWTPPLLAIAGEQPLKLVTGVAGIGIEGSNALMMVKEGSGYESYGDLSGKKIATNAPRSVLSLLAQAVVTADGGDGNSIEIVPLPFGEIARAVSEGTVDAGVIVEPFINAAAGEFPDVVSIGDPALVVQEEGDPSTLIFSSAGTMSDKADAIGRFQQAFAEAAAYANDHPDDVRRLGAELTDVPAEAAELIPVSPFVTDVDAARLQPLLDAMVTYQWVEGPIDVTDFLG